MDRRRAARKRGRGDAGAARIPVAIVLDHPAQHFAQSFRETAGSGVVAPLVLYRSIGDAAFDPGFEQRVTWDVDLTSGYDWWAPTPSGSRVATAASIWRALNRQRPRVLVSFGWSSAIARTAMAWATATRTPFLLYGDSTWQHSPRPWLRPVRAAALRALFAVSAGALSTGTFNREFYIRLGMHPADVHDGVCPADVEFFSTITGTDERTDPRFAIGYAGKLIPRKGVDELLQALARLGDRRDWRAVIIGDGPERGALEEQATRTGLTERVEFVGFQNTSRLPALLSACDVVVVPSTRDLRALVTIEAMAAGAAIVVSSATAVWGRGDLVEHGLTGMVYPSGQPAELAATLARLMDEPELADGLRRAGSTRAQDFGPDAFRAGLEKAVLAHAG